MFNFFKKASKGESDASNGDAQNAAPQQATPYTETKKGQLRYQVEHEFFRDFFFQNGPGLIDSILEPHGLGNVFCTALKELRSHPKYYDDEFRIDSMKTDAGDYMVSCKLPTPEHIGLCYRMHFAFSPDFSRSAYYTIERAAEGATLCMWDSEGNHHTIHAIEEPDWKKAEDPVAAMNAELDEIASLFTLPGEAQPEEAKPEETEPEEAELEVAKPEETKPEEAE